MNVGISVGAELNKGYLLSYKYAETWEKFGGVWDENLIQVLALR